MIDNKVVSLSLLEPDLAGQAANGSHILYILLSIIKLKLYQ